MKIQKSPNRWSCLPTAFAIAMDMPVEELIEEIGHDGSEVIWPDLPESFRRCSFHLQEIIDAAYKNDFAIVPIEAEPISLVYSEKYLYKPDFDPNRIKNYLGKEKGVILGTWADRPHAVAWDGLQIYDPNGRVYSSLGMDVKIWMFCLVKGIGFQNQIKRKIIEENMPFPL